MKTSIAIALLVLSSLVLPGSAGAAEICGNATDDDADGMADEGCYNLSSGQCESPLSCSDTGMVSPILGSLRYQLPPDVAPKSPFGPAVGLRRFYTSKYAPVAGAPAYRKALGDRWQHTYMTWLDRTGSPPTSKIVLHTNRGQDVQFTWLSAGGGFDVYKPQTGFHVSYLRQAQAAPNKYELRTLTGETIVYDSGGKLIEIWDVAANKVLVAYDGAGQISTVTDATTKRRLLFAYTSARVTSVQFQTNYSGTWTTQHTTSYAYTSANMTTVTIGGSLAQTNVYTSNYLTQIKDAANNNIASFEYTATAGQVARIDTPRGVIGFEYASTRAACSGKTVVHFNLGKPLATTCTTDANCSAGFLCGGKKATGTGVCFRAARCLTVSSPSEDVITNVAPLGPPSESCTGACTDVQQYVWNTGAGVLDLKATQDPAGFFTSRTFDANGMPTAIAYGDGDSDATNTNQNRTEFRFYTDTNFPGKVTEIRRMSDLNPGICTAGAATNCAQTLYAYNAANGKVATITEKGWTRTPDSDNGIVAFTYVTAFSYDGRGRLLQIDGPLAGAHDVTTFDYYGATSSFDAEFVKFVNRKKDTTTQFLTQEAASYDFWGNPTSLVEPDTTRSCLTFDSARGYLRNWTENMAGQANCTTSNTADLQTKWTRDSALRLTQFSRPDGSCVFYEYDTKGRLLRIKRRDDCAAASSGDRQELVYDNDGLVTEVQTYDAANVLTAKQPYTYFDSRRLEKVINPVDATKWTGLTYDSRGLLSQVDAAGALGRTVYNRSGTPGNEGRVSSVDKYYSVAGSAFDTWNLLFVWLGSQLQVTDGDAKVTRTERDDLGRTTRLTSPDMSYPTQYLYDAASRLTLKVEGLGGGAAVRRTSNTFDNLGRALAVDFLDASCPGASVPEIERFYDSAPLSCPIIGGCTRTQGRLAYIRATISCAYPFGWIDQETFYGYDDAGRLISETIRDGAGRGPEQQLFAWTKNGDLSQMTTVSGAVLGWTYGSAGNNSDADLVTAQWRTSTATPVTNAIQWNPFGPLKQYNQQNTLSSIPLRTRISRNLAYRPTGLYVETQTGGTVAHSVVLAEDVKGRVTKRDYTPNTSGVQDSYFLYDDQDRLLCETTNLVGSCPSSGSNIKNSHTASPPFMHSGDWKTLQRPIPGSTGLTHTFNIAATSHKIASVTQSGTPSFGDTIFAYSSSGERVSDNNDFHTHDTRNFFFDQRHNNNAIWNEVYGLGTWMQFQSTSQFDGQNRRMLRTFYNPFWGTSSTWYFYYDPYDRLTQVRYTPSITAPTTYQVFEFLWLGDKLTAYWQTDYPSATTSKRYVSTDETDRPLDMMSWPASGDATRIWAINPSSWGFDTLAVGPFVYQPLLFAGQYRDENTDAYENDGATVHRPSVALNGYRTYDPFAGAYLQVDPIVAETWSSYVYATSDPIGKQDRDGRVACTPDMKTCSGTNNETVVIVDSAPTVPTTWSGWGGFGWGVSSPQVCTTPTCLLGGLTGGAGGGGGPPGPPGPLTCTGALPPRKDCTIHRGDNAACMDCCEWNYENVDGEKCRDPCLDAASRVICWSIAANLMAGCLADCLAKRPPGILTRDALEDENVSDADKRFQETQLEFFSY